MTSGKILQHGQQHFDFFLTSDCPGSLPFNRSQEPARAGASCHESTSRFERGRTFVWRMLGHCYIVAVNMMKLGTIQI